MNDRDKELLQRAIDHGYSGLAQPGGDAIGAVIAKDGQILAEGYNLVKGTHDPTAHAEIVVLRQACARLADESLEGHTIYVSAEPCPMCYSALFWAKIDRIVYAVEKDKAGNYENFKDDELLEVLRQPIDERPIASQQMLRQTGIELLDKREASNEEGQ